MDIREHSPVRVIEEAKPGETEVFSVTLPEEMEERYRKEIENGRKSVVDFFEEQVHKTPEKIAVKERIGEGVYRDIKYKEVLEDAKAFSRGIIQNNLIPEVDIEEMKIGFLAVYLVNRYESLINDLACSYAGAITVSLFDEPVDHLEYLLNRGHFVTVLIEKKIRHKAPK